MEKKFAGLRSGIETSFEWLSIMVIPTLFISSVIISLELLPGVATFTIGTWQIGAIAGNLAQATMMLSIEAAMVGCTVVAKRAKKEHDADTRKKYNAFGILFFGLFVLTVAFQALHIPSQFDVYLTLVRCVAAGLYAYLCHGDEDSNQTLRTNPMDSDHTVMVTPPDFTPKIEELTAKVEELLRTIVQIEADTKTTEADSKQALEDTQADTSGHVLPPVQTIEIDVSEEAADVLASDVSMRTLSGIQRTLAYAALHPEDSQQDIADALEVSVRTVRRHLSMTAHSGQVAADTGHVCRLTVVK